MMLAAASPGHPQGLPGVGVSEKETQSGSLQAVCVPYCWGVLPGGVVVKASMAQDWRLMLLSSIRSLPPYNFVWHA